MKIYLVEKTQSRPRWGKPVKHVAAKNAKEAIAKFDYLRDCVGSPKFRAHELRRDEFGEINGKEDCPDCYEYLHSFTRYYCHTENCDTQGVLLSQYDLVGGQGQVNCEYCDKPLRKNNP